MCFACKIYSCIAVCIKRLSAGLMSPPGAFLLNMYVCISSYIVGALDEWGELASHQSRS